jgi:leucyl-tRNA synthetase
MELINEMYKYKELDTRNDGIIKEGIQTKKFGQLMQQS